MKRPQCGGATEAVPGSAVSGRTRHTDLIRVAFNCSLYRASQSDNVHFYTYRDRRAERGFVLAFRRAEADTDGITARSVASICDEIAGRAPALTPTGVAQNRERLSRFNRKTSQGSG
jgi:hypothetical protein